MSVVPAIATNRLFGSRGDLLRSASLAAVVSVMLAVPAQAQLTRMNGAPPTSAVGGPAPVAVGAAGAVNRSASMRAALQAQRSTQEQAEAIRSYVTAARQAAAASAPRVAGEGISATGLYPIATIREAMDRARLGNTAGANELLVAARAANDVATPANPATNTPAYVGGLRTWDGAGLPTVDATNTKVEIVQNQSRAVLSWESFNIGANTTLTFKQAQPDWIAVNRVVNSVNPTVILGQLNADGQVYVLNNAGVIFGKGSQTKLRTLVASTLELGNYASSASPEEPNSRFRFSTIQDRNVTFLNNGILPTQSNEGLSGFLTPAPPLFLSPLVVARPGTAAADGTVGNNVSLGDPVQYLPAIEGSVIVDPGATITAATGGSIILAAPLVDNSGILQAAEGQISLVGGRLITAAQLTGEATSSDPNVRGLYLRAVTVGSVGNDIGTNNEIIDPRFADPARDPGIVINSGLIESRLGFLSLVTTELGSILNEGLLASTTSVSRNGKIGLYGGSITIARAPGAAQPGAITILPDETGESIPQGSEAEPANFKRSVIEFGVLRGSLFTRGAEPNIPVLGGVLPTNLTFGDETLLYAPNAIVTNTAAGNPENFGFPSVVTIGRNARLDVAGLKDVEVDVSRNFVTIDPVKRNELRDTPNYREVALGNDFTLNGTILTVDVRRTGVRADGVRWVGSPLLEAGSIASQIPVSVSELMTKGGDVSFFTVSGANATAGPAFSLGQGATVDVSGGWLSYQGALVTTSKLLTADGRIVDIGDADPNDSFVAVSDGFLDSQPRFGVANVFRNPINNVARTEAGYDEGRDAGSLIVAGSGFRTIEGIILGAGYAGSRQAVTAQRPTSTRRFALGDPRRLQSSGGELPNGAYVSIGALSQNLVFYNGALGSNAASPAQLLLDTAMLSAAQLSALTLTGNSATFGGADVNALGLILTPAQVASGLTPADLLTLDGASTLALAPGGILDVDTINAIRVFGSVSAPAGTINLATTLTAVAGNRVNPNPPFEGISLPAGTPIPKRYDITVTGSLSAAGLWVNDFLGGEAALGKGRAWINGGAINLAVASNIFQAIGPTYASARTAADLSGSIDILSGALLDVSAGGYVRADQVFDFTGKGGSVSLVSNTTYASFTPSLRSQAGNTQLGDQPLYGSNQSVGFTPLAIDAQFDQRLVPSLVVDASAPRAHVAIADGTLQGFGFGGGGTFTLVAPDITFGSETQRTDATHIGLDFLAKTGFGALDLTSNRSLIVANLFNNGLNYNSAFRQVATFAVRAGETFDLTQTLLPQITNQQDLDVLLGFATGGSIRTLAALSPVAPGDQAAFDRKAVNLRLGGLGELFVESGGAVVGAAGAVIQSAKVINAGTITLPGGTISQGEFLTDPIFGGRIALSFGAAVGNNALGVRSLSEALGGPVVNGRFSETALNSAGVINPVTGSLATNAQLFTIAANSIAGLDRAERFVVILGEGNGDVGVELRAGSVTNLSGTALYDPRARFVRDAITGVTRQIRTGRIVGGGAITSASSLFDDVVGSPPPAASARLLNALPGSIVDLSGTRATFDVFVPTEGFVVRDEWSRGGRLSALSGGSIAGARINAFGGYADDTNTFVQTGLINTNLATPQALGGTLEWLNPTLRATDPGVITPNALFANRIDASGFDTLIARGGMVFDGVFDLVLGKALFATGRTTANGAIRIGEAVQVSATPNSDASITAPYVRFEGRAATASAGLLDPAQPASLIFNGGALGIDFVGSTAFDGTIGTLAFITPGDIRFTGVDPRIPIEVQNATRLPTLDGQVRTRADTLFDAGRVYATTGTGNLQAILEYEIAGRPAPTASDRRTLIYNPYLVRSEGLHTITFGGSAINRDTPLSAGSFLAVEARDIVQNGHLAAPIGRLALGTDVPTVLFGTPPFPDIVIPATRSVTFGDKSLTTVAGGSTPVPYGTTLDLKEYFFTPFSNTPVAALPTGQLTLTADSITVDAGATVDLKGGGDVFAYEFVSGVGGSRDVLDRISADAFSSNAFNANTGTGFQFADRRQVYAIIPVGDLSKIAPFDPILSADYGQAGPSDLYGNNAGLSVRLDASSGVPAGEYLLLPAHYALLDGKDGIKAYRLVENTGRTAPAEGDVQTVLDGSVIVSGNYVFAGTGLAESTQRSFTLQSGDVVRKSARIETTSGSATITAVATRADKPVPRLPVDAARLILSPLTALKIAGFFDTAAGGGKGTQVDIGGDRIIVAPALTNGLPTGTTTGQLTLLDSTLSLLNADSLFIGGTRAFNADGTTDLRISANTITVRSGVDLGAPELLLAVGNQQPDGTRGTSNLTIEAGAILRATGTLADRTTDDFVIRSSTVDAAGTVSRPAGFASGDDASGAGSTLRLANGPERLIKRVGDAADDNTRANALLNIRAATLTGAGVSADNLAIETSFNFNVDDAASLDARNIALIGDSIVFNRGGFNGVIRSTLLDTLTNAERLTLRSPNAIQFADAAIAYPSNANGFAFNDLVIDAPALTAIQAGNPALATNIAITADDVRWSNSFAAANSCNVTLCGRANTDLSITASGEVAFGGGTLRTINVGGNVRIAAADGIYYEGAGKLDVGNAALTLTTPFIADRAASVDPREQAVRPDFTIATNAAITIAAPANTLTPAVNAVGGNRAPGARLAFGTSDARLIIPGLVQDIVVNNALLLASAGVVDLRTQRNLTLIGSATIAAPGFTKRFGDAVDFVTVTAPGGLLNLFAPGDITFRQALGAGNAVLRPTLISDTGPAVDGKGDPLKGAAGAIHLIASAGLIQSLDAQGAALAAFAPSINPGVAGDRLGDFTFDSGRSAFDLTAFLISSGPLFGGDFTVRSGAGNLVIGAQQTLNAEAVSLTADGGAVTVAGTIKTAGSNVHGLNADGTPVYSLSEASKARVAGGKIELYGQTGVSLAASAKLDTSTLGYADRDPRSARAGDVTLGIGDAAGAAIDITAGAQINASASRVTKNIADGFTKDTGRFVAESAKEPGTLVDRTVYRFVEADLGGTITLRAPVVGNTVDIRLPTTSAFIGADEVQIAGVRRYNLNALQGVLGIAAGGSAGDIVLDPSAGYALPTPFAGNLLSSDFVTAGGIQSIPNFIRTFNVSAADATTSFAGINLRPAVDLVSTGAIALNSQWNLAAATVDQAAAFAAGLFDRIEPLSTPGNPVYALKTGREADLLGGFGSYAGADFLYRVDGKASGQAPIITIRARGDATIARSISDGFFVFRDRSDVAYTNYQLGGGNRLFIPALPTSCSVAATPTCNNVAIFNDPNDPVLPIQRPQRSVRIQLNPVASGTTLSPANIASPYSALANNSVAQGTAIDITTGAPVGASLTYGELFPVLSTGAMASSDIAITAGSDARLSANPNHVNLASQASVRVTDGIPNASGDPTRPQYRIEAVRGVPVFAGNDLQVRFGAGPSAQLYALDELVATDVTNGFNVAALEDDSFTILSWGGTAQGSYQFARDTIKFDTPGQQLQYFNGRTFVRAGGVATQVIAPLSEVLAFLEATKPEFLRRLANGQLATNLTPLGVVTVLPNRGLSFVDTMVRTGDGSINVASANNIDIRGSNTIAYRNETGAVSLPGGLTSQQVGGTAIYTAGQQIAPGATVTGRRPDAVGTGATITLKSELLTPTPENISVIPSAAATAPRKPILAANGGDLNFVAGGSILGRDDDWTETYLGRGPGEVPATTGVGGPQAWRNQIVGQVTEVGLAPQFFRSGLGALAGGNLSVAAGRNIDQLTVALDTSITTELDQPFSPNTLITFGSGNLAVRAGANVVAGQFDVTAGQARFEVGNAITEIATLQFGQRVSLARNTTFQMENATFDVAARGVVTDIVGGGSLYSAISGLSVGSLDDVIYRSRTSAPPSLELTSIAGGVRFNTSLALILDTTLFPSPIGQLSILSAQGLRNVSIAMLDSDPSLFGAVPFGAASLVNQQFPGINVDVTEAQRRLIHNNLITHRDDPLPARIFTDGSIDTSSIILAKQGSIVAGVDIVNSYIVGQNINPTDQTRIAAGRDITATTESVTSQGSSTLPFFGPNTIIVGGPGTVSVEAGRDLGPFATSANAIAIPNQRLPGGLALGGIYTVGNDYNPWLPAQGADLNVLFGVGPGMDYVTLRETYLNPANFRRSADGKFKGLDADLFVLVPDAQNNLRPDPDRQVYAPVLAAWLRDNAPALFKEIFGTTSFPDDAALATAAYAQSQALYDKFVSLPLKQQQPFLIKQLYFNELEQPSLPTSPSFQQYIRGYRAIEALFPTRFGYTDNLAAYDLDPATVTADNPLGVPRRKIVNGQPLVADRVSTGNADLRFSAVQTARGGEITILGPGGDFLAGSVVRSSVQPLRRSTAANALTFGLPSVGLRSQNFTSIPSGYEGILTLRGGAVRFFSDGDLRLNQSRLFTNATGNISAWSSNGDLNAGQGPKSAANFPPVTVRFGLNGLPVVDTAGGIVGAGIGAFKQSPTDPDSRIVLVAPVGEVDAGDAGVRASGDIFVAAARVANADNFKAGGTISGVPSNVAVAAPAVPAAAGAALAAIIRQSRPAPVSDDLRTLISVDIVGFAGGDRCQDPNNTDPDCPR
ncbi:MAG: filamentous hemagglutinin family protein [Sphingomonadaceae bacterium]